jgi:hypothetical protein
VAYWVRGVTNQSGFAAMPELKRVVVGEGPVGDFGSETT